MKRNIILKWVRIMFGLLIFSAGCHLTIFANLGLGPWECLAMGLSFRTPMGFGTATLVVSAVILLIVVLLGEKIGFGTIFSSTASGYMIELFNSLNPLPTNENLLVGLLVLLLGFVLMAIGMWLYLGSAQGAGPRDALMVGLGKRMPKIPIGIVEIILWLTVLAGGWKLGGPVGIGTLICTFGTGLVMQFVFSLLHFEPRNVQNMSVAETIAALKAG